MASFLAAGGVLINPALLAYAVVETDSEGPRLRLGFNGPAGGGPRELLVEGFEARTLLGWLRSNARFLDAGGPSSGRRRPMADSASPGDSRPERPDRAVDCCGKEATAAYILLNQQEL